MARRRRPGTISQVVSNRPPLPAILPVYRPKLTPLTALEDRRRYHPLGPLRPAATMSRLDQRYLVERQPKIPPTYRDPFPSLKLGFAVPKKVVRCVRRHQRRRALFAFNLTSKGSGARTRRRDRFSDIRC